MSNNIQQLLEIAKTQNDEDRALTLREISRLDRIEREKYSQDMVRIHNINMEDHVVIWDKSGANLRYLIPGKEKSIGEGKGNKTVPRYIAEKARKEIIEKRITNLSKEDMERKLKKYNGNWPAGYEENNAIRTNDPKLWEQFAPEVWLGVVSKFGSDTEEVDLEDEKIVSSQSLNKDIFNKLGLDDKQLVLNKNKVIQDAIGNENTTTTN